MRISLLFGGSMKPDINNILNKLISYAFDNLLLDALDETYTLNKLAKACKIAVPVQSEVDYGNSTIEELIAELKTVCPEADITAVNDALFPLPRTVNYYFADALDRNPKKAFDFLFELYASGYSMISKGSACGKDGYIGYAAAQAPSCASVALPACGDLKYTPKALGNHVATIENPDDVLAEDVFSREAAFVTAYGGAIATRLGANTDYYSAEDCALTHAAVKKDLSSGAVKTFLLDYPVPALAFNGVAKNAVMREATRIANAAVEAGYRIVLAAAAKDGVTLYIVFAGGVEQSEYIKSDDALTVCGVYQTADFSALLPVLEKGTALSTDLMQFKQLYEQIGGVKLGGKAAETLGGALAEKFKPALFSAASCSIEQAVALVNGEAL